MSKIRRKKDLKKGEKIYIIESSIMNNDNEPELKEYIIDEVNSSSLYFKNDWTRIRISLRDLKGKSALSHYKAYLNKEDYYNEKQINK